PRSAVGRALCAWRQEGGNLSLRCQLESVYEGEQPSERLVGGEADDRWQGRHCVRVYVRATAPCHRLRGGHSQVLRRRNAGGYGAGQTRLVVGARRPAANLAAGTETDTQRPPGRAEGPRRVV